MGGEESGEKERERDMVFTAIRTINDLSGPRKGGPFHTYFGSRSERAKDRAERAR